MDPRRELDPETTPGTIEIEIGDEAVADAIACCRGQEEFAAGKFERGVLRFSDLAPGEWLVGPYDLVRFARYGGKGLEHLPLVRVTLGADDTKRLAWDPRWTPIERLTGRVDAVGIDPSRLHVVAPPLRFLAVIVEPWGQDRVLAEGPIDRPLRVECGSVEIDVAGLEIAGKALVELTCSPGTTELKLPTNLSLTVTSGTPLRVDDLPVDRVRVRLMKAPHQPADADWTLLSLNAGATTRFTLLSR